MFVDNIKAEKQTKQKASTNTIRVTLVGEATHSVTFSNAFFEVGKTYKKACIWYQGDQQHDLQQSVWCCTLQHVQALALNEKEITIEFPTVRKQIIQLSTNWADQTEFPTWSGTKFSIKECPQVCPSQYYYEDLHLYWAQYVCVCVGAVSKEGNLQRLLTKIHIVKMWVKLASRARWDSWEN